MSLFIFRPREGSGGPANRLIEIGKGGPGEGRERKKGGTDSLLPSSPFFPSLFLAPLPPSQTLFWLAKSQKTTRPITPAMKEASWVPRGVPQSQPRSGEDPGNEVAAERRNEQERVTNA